MDRGKGKSEVRLGHGLKLRILYLYCLLGVVRDGLKKSTHLYVDFLRHGGTHKSNIKDTIDIFICSMIEPKKKI